MVILIHIYREKVLSKPPNIFKLMATHHFHCSVCGRSVSARSEYYRKYLGRYDCKDQTELSKHYICKGCRKGRGESFHHRKKVAMDLQEYPKFSEIQGYISVEATKLARIGLNNGQARQLFLDNVKVILDQEGIISYNFIIENNALQGITLKIPFIGNIEMPINTNKDI